MTIRVRLTTPELREWRHNQVYVTDKEGNIIRPADATEQLAEGEFLTNHRTLKKLSLVKAAGGRSVQIVNCNGRVLAFARNAAEIGAAPQAPTSPQAPPEVVFDPEHCQCTGWAQRPAGRHHPICSHRDAWESFIVRKRPHQIIDLDSGEAIRPATYDEILLSEGEPVITIDRESFGIAAVE